jgi:hypothetical protein
MTNTDDEIEMVELGKSNDYEPEKKFTTCKNMSSFYKENAAILFSKPVCVIALLFFLYYYMRSCGVTAASIFQIFTWYLHDLETMINSTPIISFVINFVVEIISLVFEAFSCAGYSMLIHLNLYPDKICGIECANCFGASINTRKKEYIVGSQ